VQLVLYLTMPGEEPMATPSGHTAEKKQTKLNDMFSQFSIMREWSISPPNECHQRSDNSWPTVGLGVVLGCNHSQHFQIPKSRLHSKVDGVKHATLSLSHRATIFMFQIRISIWGRGPLQDLPVFTDPVDLPQWLCLLATVTGSARFQISRCHIGRRDCLLQVAYAK
jgi:hypothetical protein